MILIRFTGDGHFTMTVHSNPPTTSAKRDALIELARLQFPFSPPGGMIAGITRPPDNTTREICFRPHLVAEPNEECLDSR